MFKSLNPHKNELISGLLDAIKLEMTIQQMKSHPREEDISKFYASQSALDEKCQALSCMSETKRSTFKLYDYLDSLVAWSKEVASITSQYRDAQLQKDPLDFQPYLQGNDLQVPSVGYFALWIQHLEKRIAISQRYLEMISRKDRDKATSRCSTSTIVSNGHSVESQTEKPSTNLSMPDSHSDTVSTLEEGEIREDAPQISKGPSKCSELLRQVEEFHDSHAIHKATLTALMDEVQGMLEKAQTRPDIPVGDAQVLKAQVLAEACCIEVKDTAITEVFCGEVLLQTFLFTIEAYEKAWAAIQAVIDIVESITRMSIRTQMQGLHRS